uniref:gamma-tubulin complex component 2-like n=1 Tax=Oncorhynchus gorbuscha TaxID=8017 RepID=UPI001EAF2895|nr:gamma-tubulin complex component 2-like [Oncorhynchus gorbuscha]
MSVCVMFTNCMQCFTRSIKLDQELNQLSLEHGTMEGPPTQSERTEEQEKKRLTSKRSTWTPCSQTHASKPPSASLTATSVHCSWTCWTSSASTAPTTVSTA